MAVFLTRRFPKGPTSPKSWGLAGLGAAVGVFLLLKATDTPWFGDYESAYYPAGQLILTDPNKIYGQECAFGFVNLPLVAFPLVPFSLFGYRPAVLLFSVMGVLLIALAARLIMKSERLGHPEAKGLILALFVVNGPLWYSVREGNLTHFLIWPLLVALLLLMDRKDVLAGAILGVVAIIKLPLVLFFGYLVARLRWRAALGFVGAVALIGVASLLVHGVALHEAWLNQCIFPYAGKPLAAFNVQSLSGFWARMYGGDTYNWSPSPIGGSFQLVQRATSIGLFIGVSLVLLKVGRPRTDRAMGAEFSIILVFMLLFSPLSWTHYFLFALIPMAMLLSGALTVPPGRPWAVVWWASLFALSLPLRGFNYDWPWFRFVYDRVFASHHMYGGIGLLVLLLVVRWRQASKGAAKAS